jgi:hypothetical protein
MFIYTNYNLICGYITKTRGFVLNYVFIKITITVLSAYTRNSLTLVGIVANVCLML